MTVAITVMYRNTFLSRNPAWQSYKLQMAMLPNKMLLCYMHNKRWMQSTEQFFLLRQITESTTKRMKRSAATWVREALSGKHDGHPVRALIINLPRPEEHTDHDVSKVRTSNAKTHDGAIQTYLQMVRLRGPLDARVRQKIKELVSENVLSTEQVLRHLRRYVKTLFPDETPPSYNNRRFYPPRRVIRS